MLCILSIGIGVLFYVWGRVEGHQDEVSIRRRRRARQRRTAQTNLTRAQAPQVKALPLSMRDHASLFRLRSAGRGYKVGRGR